MDLKSLTLFTFLFVSFSSIGQVQDVIYYDETWRETTQKEDAAFYRNLPLEEKDGKLLIKDYYISGALQMSGWADKNDEDIFVAETKWFYENGNPSTINNYKNGRLDGVATHFYENGVPRHITNFKNGEEEGKESHFDTTGKLIASIINKDGKPYDGLLIKNDSEIMYTTHFKKGLKTSEKIEYGSNLIAEGTFLNGEPHNGSFVENRVEVNDWVCSKITTLKNGKEEGKQYFKRLEENEPYTYYYARNGLKDGPSYDYDHRSETAYKLDYKEGIPFEGELLDENRNVLIYKKGVLTETKKRTEERGFFFYEIYKNDIKTGVEYELFYIDGETVQRGTYKDNLPYNGCFLRPMERLQFPILDYYKKGKKTHQYSKGIVKDEEGVGFDELKLPFKSDYKNDVIFSGTDYKAMSIGNSAAAYIFKVLDEGKITGISLWVFAMHYGNNIVLRSVDKTVEITEYAQPQLKIILSKEEVTLLYDGEVLEQRKKGNLKDNFDSYFLENGELKKTSMWFFSDAVKEKMENIPNIRNQVTLSLYTLFIPNTTVSSIFEKFDSEFIDKFYQREEQYENYLASMSYNELGKPKSGFLIDQKNDLFNVQFYEETDLKVSKEQLTLQELKTYIETQTKENEED